MAKAKKKTAARERTGVCARGYELIRQGKTNEQVLAELQKKFPKSDIKMGGVSWLRNKLRSTEKGIKMNRELTAAAAAKGKTKTKKAA